MKKIDRRIIIVGAFIFIVALSYGIMRFLISQGEEPRMRPPVEAKRYVKAQPVEYTKVLSPVEGTGRVISLAQLDLVAEASGKLIVSDIPLKKGSRFSRGDELFTVYPDEAALALKARKSRFLNSLANLLPDLAIDFPEQEQIFRDFFNAVHLDESLPSFPAVKNEQLRIFLASRDVLSEYYSIKKDELRLSRHTLFAPFDGAYTDVYLEAGAYTNMGGRVARAIRTDILEMEVPLERFDARWVEVGDRTAIYDTERNFQWEGVVTRKSPFVDPENQSQTVFIRVQSNAVKPLFAGAYLKATFPGQPINGVMEIPRNVFFNTNEVFVVNDTRLHKRTIDIVNVNKKTLLFKGLKEGEMLVMQPLINVQEGTRVEIYSQEQGEKEKNSE